MKELDSNYSSVPWAHFLDKLRFLDYHKLPLEAWAGKSKNLNARGCWATCGAGIWTPDSSPTGLAWTLAGSVFPTHGFFKSFKSENYTQNFNKRYYLLIDLCDRFTLPSATANQRGKFVKGFQRCQFAYLMALKKSSPREPSGS